MGNYFYLVLPRLRLEMLPQYDFSIRSGDILNLKCSVVNPESLDSLSHGSLVWLKDNQDNLKGILKIYFIFMVEYLLDIKLAYPIFVQIIFIFYV